jgi:hypothetical protein
MYKLTLLSPSVPEAYEELTYPRFRSLLQKLALENRVVAEFFYNSTHIMPGNVTIIQSLVET